MKSLGAAAVAFSLGSAFASVSPHSVSSDVSFSISIPESTANTGSGDVFFQLKASTKYSWVGLGQGGEMAGSNMLIMYLDSSGRNVTVSPRLASGESMPHYNSGARITVLEGSGVENDVMIANVLCSSCSRWSGGSMDFAASSAQFIYGTLEGSPLNSDSPSENIEQHSKYGPFSWTIARAKGGNDANPFIGPSDHSTGATPTQTGSSSATSAPASSSSSSASVMDSGISASQTTANNMLLAHGVVACIAFVALFPIGGILIRVANFTGLLWVHAALQGFAFLFYIVAFSMGVYIATVQDQMDETHAHLGIALLAALAVQPIFGFVHHKMFNKYGTRTFWSHAHLWLGRLIIPVGMVNGYLGIDLAGDADTGERVAYVAVAAVMLTLYILAIIYGEFTRWKKNKEQLEPYEKDQQPLSNRQQRRQSFRLQDMNSNQQGLRPVQYSRNDSARHQGYYARDENTRNQTHTTRDTVWPQSADYYGGGGGRRV